MIVLHVYVTWYCMIYNVNGVVYFCVTCVNASRILCDQHGIVLYVVLYCIVCMWHCIERLQV